MKKLFTLLALLPLASVFGQAIIINSGDMPVPAGITNMVDLTLTSPPNPVIGTNIFWNYGNDTGSAASFLYVTETDTFFTHAGIDVNTSSYKSFNDVLGYFQTSELDFNTTGVVEAGIHVPFQGFDLSAYTGSATDSLIIPDQKALLSSTRDIVHFPFTANTTWHSVSRQVTNFQLNAPAYMLNYAPCKHVYYIHRDDTVIGWGKMRVHTTSGPSMLYDVLMDKSAQYAVDSYYVSGAPASAAITTAFSVSQGQKTDSSFSFLFYRKGNYNYLMNFNFKNDATYTIPFGIFYCKDGLVASNAGVGNEAHAGAYSTVLFPNPSVGNEVNFMVMGKTIDATQYTITDVTGHTLQAGTLKPDNKNVLHIDLDKSIAAGNYYLNLKDDKNNFTATEQFIIRK